MFEYQRTNRFFAQIPDGMEGLGAEELSQLGASEIRTSYRGITFRADKATLYRVNYLSRHLTRVLAPLARFQCHSTTYLYRKAKALDWSRLLTPNRTFAVFATVSHSKITHSQYAALCLKDAVVDHFREHGGKRPSVQRIDPDAWINLHIENDRAVISFDTSGGSLHRRGYRDETVDAPMQEVVAAALITLSGWDGSKPLHDPMCGSGTILMEALMAWARIPSGYRRKRFGFAWLPDFDEILWKALKRDADDAIREVPKGLISGSDISGEAIQAVSRNARRLPHGDKIEIQRRDFRDIPELGGRVIICNPPYGIRMGKDEDLGGLYKGFGDFLKQRCKGSSVYIYFGDRQWIPHIGLRPSWKRELKSGGLDGRLAKFEIY
jgi:putative N6-adenine-specific DNA methylase